METLQRTANRGSISTGYDIDNSVKLEDANNEWFFNASPTAGNRRTYTFSFWIKRTEIGAVNASGNAYVIGAGQHGRMFFGSDYFQFRFDDGHDCRNVSVQFRDTSAWYHFVVAVDTNQLSSSNRVKLYVNGESLAVDDHDGGSFPDLADQGAFFSTNYITIGTAPFGGTYNSGDGDYDMSGYLSEFCAIDGQQLDPTSFGEYDEDSGIWKPIDVSGLTFGSQGYYLNFSDSANLGDDASGNSNDFSENNIAAADQATDTPTNNFTTLNPLMANAGPANYLPITEGGTKAVNTAAAYKIANSTFGVTSGKWYWEVKATDVNGVTAIGVTMPHYWDTDFTLGGCIYYAQLGQRYNNSSASAFGATYTDGDIISFALDMDATPPTMEVYKNSVSQGNIMAGLSINGAGGAFLPVKEDGYFPKIVGYNANTFECNFGGYTTFSISSAETDENGYGTFEYAPPSGYYAICTKNLAEYG